MIKPIISTNETKDYNIVNKIVKKHNYNGVITVEQDMYKPDHDVPLKIAMKTRHYLSEIGLG